MSGTTHEQSAPVLAQTGNNWFVSALSPTLILLYSHELELELELKNFILQEL